MISRLNTVTADIDDAHMTLAVRDVPVTDPQVQAWGTSFIATDPDGPVLC